MREHLPILTPEDKEREKLMDEYRTLKSFLAGPIHGLWDEKNQWRAYGVDISLPEEGRPISMDVVFALKQKAEDLRGKLNKKDAEKIDIVVDAQEKRMVYDDIRRRAREAEHLGRQIDFQKRSAKERGFNLVEEMWGHDLKKFKEFQEKEGEAMIAVLERGYDHTLGGGPFILGSLPVE